MIAHTNKIALLLTCLSLIYTPANYGVFCTAQEYIHPTNGTTAWLFGDIHCDIDPALTITRLHQHTIFEAARQQNALIIAENVGASLYKTAVSEWLLQLGIDAFLIYKAVRNKSYGYGALASIVAIAQTASWSQENAKAYKPSCTFANHLKTLKNNALTTSLALQAGSPLLNVVPEAHKRGLTAFDVEFRYHMCTASMDMTRQQLPWFAQMPWCAYQVKHWLGRKITGNAVRYPITLKDYCTVNDAIIKEIESYVTDNAMLKSFYQECLEAYQSSYMTQTLRALAKQNIDTTLRTIIPTLVGLTDKNTATVLRDFAEHNATLFDARLAHSICSNSDNNIFVLTGAYHVDRIKNLLEKLGYQTGRMYGKDNLKILIERGAIGQTFITTDNLEHLAIDLDEVFGTQTTLELKADTTL